MQNHTQTLLRNLAQALVADAADTLEPVAGAPISEAVRQALAADILAALARHVGALVNVKHAFDLTRRAQHIELM